MSDDDYQAVLDVGLADLQLAVSDAIQTAGDLIPAKRLEHFKTRTATAQAALDKLLDGKQREIQTKWQTYESAVARHLEPGERDPIDRLLDYMQLRDLRQEMAGMESKDVRQLIADGVSQGDDRYLRAAGMGLKKLASDDFLQQQRDLHVDNRLRATDQGAKLADGRGKLEAAQEEIERSSFKVRRQATKLLETGLKQALNPPMPETEIGRSYASYVKEKAAREALAGVVEVQ